MQQASARVSWPVYLIDRLYVIQEIQEFLQGLRRRIQLTFISFRCQYVHAHTNWVVGPPGTSTTREMTCYFWATEGEGCTLAPHECSYAHYDTGTVAPRPNNIHRTFKLPQSEIHPQAGVNPQGIPGTHRVVYPYSPTASNSSEVVELKDLSLRTKPEDEQGLSYGQELYQKIDSNEVRPSIRQLYSLCFQVKPDPYWMST